MLFLIENLFISLLLLFKYIYIPSQNLMVEVKSTWTIKLKEDNINAKMNACKAAGFNYQIWVYDEKGHKLKTIE